MEIKAGQRVRIRSTGQVIRITDVSLPNVIGKTIDGAMLSEGGVSQRELTVDVSDVLVEDFWQGQMVRNRNGQRMRVCDLDAENTASFILNLGGAPTVIPVKADNAEHLAAAVDQFKATNPTARERGVLCEWFDESKQKWDAAWFARVELTPDE